MDFKRKNHVIDILFVLTLFAVFAMSAMLLVMIGASIYGRTVSSMDANYHSRTTTAYLTEKLRQSDCGNIEIVEWNDIPALQITTQIGDETFATYLYAYEGYLCELYTIPSLGLTPDAGDKLFPLQSFQISSPGNNLYCFTITDTKERTSTIYVATRTD